MHDIRALKWFSCACLVFCTGLSAATQFQADMIDSVHHDGTKRESKLYVKGLRYRTEQVENEQEVVVLVDQNEGLTHVLFTADKTYIEMASDDTQSLINDPFQAAKFMEGLGEKQKIGSEEVAGYACDVYHVMYDTVELVKMWVARKFEFPLKIEMRGKFGRTMLLRGIKETAFDDDLLMMPAGYLKMQEPEVTKPELPGWIENVTEAPFLKPPFEQKMAEGEMIRVKIEPGKGLRVQGRNETAGNSSFTAIPFRGSNPTYQPSMYTYNLSNEGQSWALTFKETPYEANDIVLHVNEGIITASVEYVDLGLIEIVPSGRELRVPVDPTENIDLRVVNLHKGKSVCTYTLMKDGVELSEERIGPIPLRTFTFDEKFENRSSTLSSSAQADEIVIQVRKGKMLVNVNQP